MGWFTNEEVVNNNVPNVPNVPTVTNTPTVEHILTAIAAIIIVIVVLTYVIAKTCNKVLNSRMSSTARREFELSRLNNGAPRVI